MLKEKFTENLIYSQVFSFEVLNYFDSITTDENYEWIKKYFNLLMKEENITAEKFEEHHVIPAFVFKDKNHKKRNETEKLANKIKENLKKLSYENHQENHLLL